MTCEEAERYFGIGEEAYYGTPEILDTVASAATLTADRDVAAPSILEVVATGISGGGDVVVPGTINGATHFDTFTLPTGDSVITGVEVFQAIDLSADAITFAGSGGTISIRVATQEFIDIIDESISADNDPIDDADRVASAFPQHSAPGPFETSGDVNLVAEPEGGFLRILKMLAGCVTSTVLGGADVLAATAIAGTLTFDNDIVPNQNGGDKKIIVKVTGTAVPGTVTIPGTVNGGADSEVVTLNAANGFEAATTKIFDGLDLTPAAITTTGLTAGTIEIEQGDAISHVVEYAGAAPSFFGRIGKDGIIEREVTGLVVDSADFVMKTGEWIKAKISIAGRTELLRDINTPAFSDLEPFDFAQSVVTRDGSPFPVVMESTFTLSNSAVKDRRSLDGSRFRRCQPWSNRTGELTAKLLFGCDEDGDETENYRRFLGNISASSPQSAVATWAMILSFISETEIYTGGETYSITLDLPNLVPAQMDEPVKGRDVIETNATFKILNAPGSYPFRFTLVNGQTQI